MAPEIGPLPVLKVTIPLLHDTKGEEGMLQPGRARSLMGRLCRGAARIRVSLRRRKETTKERMIAIFENRL
jgi:hypothetical protein